jgi:hypothetical protein
MKNKTMNVLPSLEDADLDLVSGGVGRIVRTMSNARSGDPFAGQSVGGPTNFDWGGGNGDPFAGQSVGGPTNFDWGGGDGDPFGGQGLGGATGFDWGGGEY